MESVNVGRPAPLRVGRKIVRSAFVKVPVSGPVTARWHNLVGDEQGDQVHHGGREQAVYAYASEDLAWCPHSSAASSLQPRSART